MSNRLFVTFIAPVLSILIALALPGRAADSPQMSYQMPPDHLADLVDAPSTPRVSVGPQKEWMLLMQRPELPSIDQVAAPEKRLAGLRIDPRNNGPSRARYYNGLSFKKLPDGEEVAVEGLGENPRISNLDWSPDGRKVAFTMTFLDRIELWMVEAGSSEAKRLTDLKINDAYGSPFYWLAGSGHLLVCAVPADRGPQPKEPIVPAGPNVQENLGRKTPARTYQDLLASPYDESMFEWLLTKQLVELDLKGNATPVGKPALYRSAQPSPDGEYLLVKTVHRPYSYTVPVYRFPLRIEVWNRAGEVVHMVYDAPLADQIPIAYGSVRTGPRSVYWRPDQPATLYWTEALDGGDAGQEAEWRDQVYTLESPFDGEPEPLIKLGMRYSGISWGDEDLALVTEYWWKSRRLKQWRIWPSQPEKPADLLQDRDYQDRYGDPGDPLMRPTEWGTRVLLTADDGQTLFLVGSGASDEGDRPFLDRFDLKTKETERLFRSEAPYYERPVKLIDVDDMRLLTRRESVDQPPNYYLRDLESGKLEPITHFEHPTPALVGVQKELVKFEREDGIELSGELYLPADYDTSQGPLPMLMWAYPREYKDKQAASQVQGSPYRFVRVGWWSPLLWLVDGYAVLDHPTMPIVAEGDEEPNDTYVEQLTASAQAAVDAMVSRGVADPQRIAIGGHSYGAFMAANLLAHGDMFRAGIARSGAYNRTLTPFGFQAEERTFWEAPDVYFTMSPFMHADKIDEPLLMIHGEADNNSGTYPLQSERMYGALKGLGATARLCMLPAESHSYRARESIMHMVWEMTEWLDEYVRNADPRETIKTKPDTEPVSE